MASTEQEASSLGEETMYAIRYYTTAGGIEKNFKIEKATPKPPALKDGETLVQVACAALNPFDHKLPEVPVVGRLAVGIPAIPCVDYSGTVAETKNPALRKGQRVFGRLATPCKFGTMAEYTVVTAAGCVPLPDGISFPQSAALGTAALTAYQTLQPYAKGKSGLRVFLNGGSGGTGTYGIQMAKALGFYVVTTCSSRNASFCKELGADEVIEYDRVDVCKALVEMVGNDATKAFDHCVDNIGTPAGLYKAADHFLKPEGSFVQVGAEPSLAGGMQMGSRKMMPAFLGGGKRKWVFPDVKNKSEDFEQMARWMGEGRLRSVIDSTFGFEEAGKAYEKIKTGRTRGKIVVNVSDA